MGFKDVALLFLICSTLIVLDGCSFSLREGNFREIEEWPLIKTSHTIGIYVTTKLIFPERTFDDEQRIGKKRVKKNESEFLAGVFLEAFRAFSDSELFTETKIGSHSSDYTANIHVIWVENTGTLQKILAVSRFLTLGVFPSYTSRQMNIQLSVLDKEGNMVGKYSKAGNVVKWDGLLLLPLIPAWIWWDDDSPGGALYDLFRLVIIDADRQGVFGKT